MKMALFGGTFNPLHLGHLNLAEELRTEYGYDQVIFVPAFSPPHKTVEHDTDPQLRLKMVRRAVEPAGFLVDDCEINRKGVSYTLDTVKHIYKAYPVSGRLSLVIGDDLLEGLTTWHSWEELISLVHLVIARRVSNGKLPCEWPHTYLDNMLFPVSSKDVRERVRGGRAFRFLVPESVYDRISSEGLYRQ
jgi:nicotinate-nucleotide adenylyltransferase